MGPLGSIMVVDYILKRFQINLREIYTQKRGSGYWYHWGVNPYAFIALVVGAGLSFWMYNPLTAAVAQPSVFKIAGAAIPSSLAAGVVYYGLARAFLVPNGIGFPEVPMVRKLKARRLAPEPQVVLAEQGTAE